MDSSFRDQEKRFILAEMIKASQIEVDAVVHFVQSCGISPDWLEMQIPHGRTVNQCRQAAAAMGIDTLPRSLPQHPQQQYRQTGQHPMPQPPQQHLQTQPLVSSGPSAKRKSPGDAAEHLSKRLAMAPAEAHSVPQPRNIQPRPAANGFVAANPALGVAPPQPTQNPPKKRGRPSRADKDAQARAAGSANYPFPVLAPASKPVAMVSEGPVSASFEASTRLTPGGGATGIGTREEPGERKLSLDGSLQQRQDTSTMASQAPPLSKPKKHKAKANIRADPPDQKPAPKSSPTTATSPSLKSRVAVSDLLKTAASAYMTTGV